MKYNNLYKTFSRIIFILLSVSIVGCQPDNVYEIDTSKANVELTIKDNNGNLLEGIQIGASAMVGSKEFVYMDKTSDKDGIVSFDNIAPADYIFYHMSESLGLYPDTISMIVEGNKSYASDFSLSMQEYPAQVGYAVLNVIDSEGKPMRGVEVSLYFITDEGETLVVTDNTDNINGTIKFFNLKPGNYRVSSGYGLVNKNEQINAGITSSWNLVVNLIPHKIPKTGWSVIAVSSEQGVWAGANVVDDNVGTWWNTSWTEPAAVRPTHPHILDIDMGEEKTFYGFVMIGAGKGWYSNGCKDFEMLVSNNGNSWTSVGIFTQDQATSAAQEQLHPTPNGAVSARYLRFSSINQWNAKVGATMCFSELGIFDYE